MSGYHAPIAPSSMALTVACNGWLQMSEGLPPENDADKPEAMEGNAADWVAKQYARGKEVEYGTPTPIAGYSVDYDMIHGARLWARTLKYGANSGVPVIISRIHPTACWGEPDGWTYDGIEQTLHVPDYKYGFDLVEAFENWQVMAYAVGLIDTLNLDDQTTKVVMTIVQPRAFHPRGPVRTWVVMADQLRAYANIMHNAAVRALQKNPPPEVKAGPHCKTLHCRAAKANRCPVLQRAAGSIAEWMREGESPLELPVEALGTEWTILQAARAVLDARLEGVSAQVEELLRKGQRVPGARMESGGAPLKWKKGVTIDDIVGLGNVIARNLRTVNADPNSRKCAVVTPTQAIKAGLDEAMVKLYAEPIPGAMKLVADDGTEARKAFGGGPPA
jgi:hypothetical protein